MINYSQSITSKLWQNSYEIICNSRTIDRLRCVVLILILINFFLFFYLLIKYKII